MNSSIRDAPDLNAEDRVFHRSGFTNNLLTSESFITRRIFRALARFFFAVLIGVGATLAWQSYGDQAMDMVKVWAPSLGEWLPVSTSKPAAPPVTSAEVQQQLKPIATDLAAVRRTIEQLTADQDQLSRTQQQMAQSIATLQAAEQQLSQRLSSPPPSKPVNVPPPKPLQTPAQLSSPPSSKPVNVLPPQPPQPPRQ
jgi:TolA-binding protein